MDPVRPPFRGHATRPLHPDLWGAAAVAILLAGAMLRVIHLDADPLYPLWAGYITDEGRWTEVARQLVLFGSATPPSELARLHLALAPLYQAATAGVFTVFGVGLGTARLVSVIGSIFLLVAAFGFFRQALIGPGLAFVLLTLAFQPDLLVLGRVAIPEMAAMCVSFLGFALVVSGGSRLRLFAAGLLTTVAVGFKATTAPLVPLFGLVVLAIGAHRADHRRRAPLTAYTAGALAPALLLLPLLVRSPELLGQLDDIWAELLLFMKPASVYVAVAGLMYRDVSPALAVFILAAWLGAGLLVPVLGHLPRGRARRLWIGSAIWSVGWVGVSSLLDYFPDRYVLHVLVPLSLNIGAAVTLLQRVGRQQVVEALVEARGWRKRLAAAWLGLPMAVLVAPAVIAAASVVGLTLDRLTHQLILVAVLEGLVIAASLRWWRPDFLIPGMVSLPLAVVALRLPLVWTGLLGPELWRPAGLGDAVAWIFLIAVPLAILMLTRDRPISGTRLMAGIYVAALTTAWLLQALPPLVSPTFTIRQASEHIETLVQNGDRVGTMSAASVFLDTDLRYVEDLVRHPFPDWLVVAFNREYAAGDEHYRLVTRLDLNLGANHVDQENLDPAIRVYRLVQPPAPRDSLTTRRSGGSPAGH